MNIYIWGTGEYASAYLETGEVEMNQIKGFIESKKRKDLFRGKRVYEPCEICEKNDYDFILVLIGGGVGREIYNTCISFHINIDKVVLLDNWEWADGSLMDGHTFECCRKIQETNTAIKDYFPVLYRWIKSRDKTGIYIPAFRNNSDFIETNALMRSDRFSGMGYQNDYFRYRTFELAANELIKHRVEGSVAELGVYRGTFSALINAKFPERCIYLIHLSHLILKNFRGN